MLDSIDHMTQSRFKHEKVKLLPCFYGTTSGLSILIHDFISLPDLTSLLIQYITQITEAEK